MNPMFPKVTIMIATKDRREPLRVTLAEMRKQDYPVVDMLVIDDGSERSIEPLVHEIWPEAKVVRHESSAGQCARRNEGFALAEGEYILQLDDDCSFVDREHLQYAVDQIRTSPNIGALSFYIINSATLPQAVDTSSLNSGCAVSFVGAAVLFRKAALEQTSGYRTFFGNEWEEEELAMQLLNRGWEIVFVPRIVAHHRLSSLNRNSARTWMRGLRNRLWAQVIHMPLSRLAVEIGWKIGMGAWDAIRLMRIRLFFQALFQCARGLGRAWRLRKPLSSLGLRRYDALRMRPVISSADFENPPAINWKVFNDYRRRWHNRPRNQSVWHADQSDIGSSYTVAYAHEKDRKMLQDTAAREK